LNEENGIFEYYHYQQLENTLKTILKDNFIGINEEQCGDKAEWT